MFAHGDDHQLVLTEFRLNAAGSSASVARIVALSGGVPLLVSIDDRRDVAVLRTGSEQGAVDAGRERVALSPFVTGASSVKRYDPRIVENTTTPPARYRMAVTESGINDIGDERAPISPSADQPREGTTHVELLWIAAPVRSYAGLLVLIGSSEDGAPLSRHDGWPLLFSRDLGVRIYESAASKIDILDETTSDHAAN